jgi:hypothetical protein
MDNVEQWMNMTPDLIKRRALALGDLLELLDLAQTPEASSPQALTAVLAPPSLLSDRVRDLRNLAAAPGDAMTASWSFLQGLRLAEGAANQVQRAGDTGALRRLTARLPLGGGAPHNATELASWLVEAITRTRMALEAALGAQPQPATATGPLGPGGGGGRPGNPVERVERFLSMVAPHVRAILAPELGGLFGGGVSHRIISPADVQNISTGLDRELTNLVVVFEGEHRTLSGRDGHKSQVLKTVLSKLEMATGNLESITRIYLDALQTVLQRTNPNMPAITPGALAAQQASGQVQPQHAPGSLTQELLRLFTPNPRDKPAERTAALVAHTIASLRAVHSSLSGDQASNLYELMSVFTHLQMEAEGLRKRLSQLRQEVGY